MKKEVLGKQGDKHKLDPFGEWLKKYMSEEDWRNANVLQTITSEERSKIDEIKRERANKE